MAMNKGWRGLYGLALLLVAVNSRAMEPWRSEDLHFAYGSAELTLYAQGILDRDIAEFAVVSREYPQLTLNICAYADKAERKPEAISRQRILEVKDYLERKGVALESLRTAVLGYSPRQPLFGASTPELNRRVEVRLDARETDPRKLCLKADGWL